MIPPKNRAAVALGRLGGRVKSEAKTRAARANAKKPRPRRSGRPDQDAASRTRP